MAGGTAGVHGEGGADGGELTCQRDNVPTRLRCAGCRTPICPRCFVRTPVGHKCPTCAAPVPGSAALASRRRNRSRAGAAIVAVIAVAFGTWALVGRSGGHQSALHDASLKQTTASV